MGSLLSQGRARALKGKPPGKRRSSRGVAAPWRKLCSHWQRPRLGARLLTRDVILMGLRLPSHSPLPAGIPLGVAPGGCGVRDRQPSSGRHPGHSPVTLLSLPIPARFFLPFLSHEGQEL